MTPSQTTGYNPGTYIVPGPERGPVECCSWTYLLNLQIVEIGLMKEEFRASSISNSFCCFFSSIVLFADKDKATLWVGDVA